MASISFLIKLNQLQTKWVFSDSIFLDNLSNKTDTITFEANFNWISTKGWKYHNFKATWNLFVGSWTWMLRTFSNDETWYLIFTKFSVCKSQRCIPGIKMQLQLYGVVQCGVCSPELSYFNIQNKWIKTSKVFVKLHREWVKKWQWCQ